MGYEYDIFISYTRRNKDVYKWVHEYFHDALERKLRNELDRKPEIFIDKSTIETGDDWKKVIKEGLAKSRILICLFVPDYFTSEWCQNEFFTFLHRKDSLSNANQMDKIIWPIQLCDGKHNPDYATIGQIEEFYHFFETAPYFKQTEEYLNFEKEVKKMARIIEERIFSM